MTSLTDMPADIVEAEDPQDVLGLAITRFDKAAQVFGWQMDQGYDGDDITAAVMEHKPAADHLKLTIAGVIKGAIISERDRCVKKASSIAADLRNWDRTRTVAAKTADAITKGGA